MNTKPRIKRIEFLEYLGEIVFSTVEGQAFILPAIKGDILFISVDGFNPKTEKVNTWTDIFHPTDGHDTRDVVVDMEDYEFSTSELIDYAHKNINKWQLED